ncbi:MAG: MjaI family restriction endonuclease [Candidatus Methanofastidiosa archaeon]|nr:MjaI family restriction endonuclease [Candidatus Methanofastidiosa archaeon]
MTRKPFTGGELNILNGKMGISAPDKSVPVARLVRYHKPKSPAELEKLISGHVNGKCPCGVVSTGTVQDFGRNLYEAQIGFWGESKYSLKDCIQWEYDLFILQMLKGNTMEDKCQSELQNKLESSYLVKNTNRFIDEEFRVDLEVFKDDSLLLGIQVKPSSFGGVRRSIQEFNRDANKNYEKPVFYVYYDYDTEHFLNIEELVEKIKYLD